MNRFLYTTMRPAMYHGHGKQAPFFEGWYFKVVTADGSRRYAIIPGVILGEEGHAFVQVLDGVTGQSAYHIYPLTQFWSSTRGFEIHIGPNRFTQRHITVQIDRPEGQIAGELSFQGVIPWPVSVASPGIMGWYAWAPRLECYHGVLGFDHAIQGNLTVDGQLTDFSGGRGYIEKDWGQSFPDAWVWFQSNHFAIPGVCITASVAIIPWVRRAFRGFIVGLTHNRRLYRFATYTGARVEKLEITDDHVTWVVRDRLHRLEMLALRVEGGLLLGPTKLDMGKRVNETLSATVAVRLTTLAGRELFSGQGRYAGLEVHGNLGRLLAL
jgi:hypothetical protein